ncbi:MAG: hypothetical protein HGB36_12775 [Chlorobiaceae bacterium]|nr:hypothetical protein [Chlorobiaceae bacterium]
MLTHPATDIPPLSGLNSQPSPFPGAHASGYRYSTPVGAQFSALTLLRCSRIRLPIFHPCRGSILNPLPSPVLTHPATDIPPLSGLNSQPSPFSGAHASGYRYSAPVGAHASALSPEP